MIDYLEFRLNPSTEALLDKFGESLSSHLETLPLILTHQQLDARFSLRSQKQTVTPTGQPEKESLSVTESENKSI